MLSLLENYLFKAGKKNDAWGPVETNSANGDSETKSKPNFEDKRSSTAKKSAKKGLNFELFKTGLRKNKKKKKAKTKTNDSVQIEKKLDFANENSNQYEDNPPQPQEADMNQYDNLDDLNDDSTNNPTNNSTQIDPPVLKNDSSDNAQISPAEPPILNLSNPEINTDSRNTPQNTSSTNLNIPHNNQNFDSQEQEIIQNNDSSNILDPNQDLLEQEQENIVLIKKKKKKKKKKKRAFAFIKRNLKNKKNRSKKVSVIENEVPNISIGSEAKADSQNDIKKQNDSTLKSQPEQDPSEEIQPSETQTNQIKPHITHEKYLDNLNDEQATENKIIEDQIPSNPNKSQNSNLEIETRLNQSQHENKIDLTPNLHMSTPHIPETQNIGENSINKEEKSMSRLENEAESNLLEGSMNQTLENIKHNLEEGELTNLDTVFKQPISKEPQALGQNQAGPETRHINQSSENIIRAPGQMRFGDSSEGVLDFGNAREGQAKAGKVSNLQFMICILILDTHTFGKSFKSDKSRL